MVCTKKWKLIHCEGGYRPILFDLKNDPDELVDLGMREDHADIIATIIFFDWARRPAQRTTRSADRLREMLFQITSTWRDGWHLRRK